MTSFQNDSVDFGGPEYDDVEREDLCSCPNCSYGECQCESIAELDTCCALEGQILVDAPEGGKMCMCGDRCCTGHDIEPGDIVLDDIE